MQLNEIKPHIIEIFQKQGIEKALEELMFLIHKNSSIFNEIILLQDRQRRNEEKDRQGVIPNNEYQLEVNKSGVDFLNLLDKIELNQNTNNVVLFNIEEALEWLKGKLSNSYFTQTVYFDSENIETISSEYEDCTFLDNGEFEFKKTVGVFRRPWKRTNTREEYLDIITKGSFKDISTVELICDFKKEGRTEKDVFTLKCMSYNSKPLFYVEEIHKRIKYYAHGVTNEKEFKSQVWGDHFLMRFNDEIIANKLKKAIDDISIHFGRKEEMY
ncbi:MAG: hypothetical protein SFU99_08995 [Saprospiraceae bacterium]|nr:hypothetical protein [Saprospiraceae bacterium]